MSAETVDRRLLPTPDRPQFSLDDIRRELAYNQHVSLIGELAVLHPRGYSGTFYPRRDFYVEPLIPPQIPELTDTQVDALNAAAYYKRQPTRVLSAIPRQFADEYNRILRDMLPPDRFPGSTMRFGFVSNLASSRVNFGYRMYSFSDETTHITHRIEVAVTDPELRMQLARVQRETYVANRAQPTEVLVRLFPPGLAQRVYDYEKGYFVDGNVEEWKELVYKGRYISVDQLSPEQLQVLARGEQPYPEVKYLPESEFQGNPQQTMELLVGRAMKRISSVDFMFGVGMPEIDDPSPELQTALAEHQKMNEKLGVGRKYGEGDFDENHPLMKQPRG